MAVNYGQYMIADTAAELTSSNGVNGYMAFAKDTKLFYGHNGVSWNSFGSMMGTLRGLQSASSTPSIAVTSVAGVSGSATIVGNNLAGKITVNTGLSLLGTGKILTMTFADGLTFPNGCFVNFTPANGNFSVVYTKLYAIGTTSTVELYVTATLSLGSTYEGYYMVIGF